MTVMSRLLLDTHVVLWWLTDDPTLPDHVKAIIDGEADVFVSAASVWEVSIKQARGKIEEPANLAATIRDSELRHLPIGAAHAVVAGQLPPIHRDPFDRMLVAQSICDDLTLVSRDRDIRRYDVRVLNV